MEKINKIDQLLMTMLIMQINLSAFDANTQTTGTSGLSAEMKTYYDDYLIDNAKPLLVHDQFGQKKPIPKNNGKIVEFRKYAPLAKALTPLTEGVTPSGNSLNVSTITATVAQYGDYITVSDVLQLTAIDNNLVEATELLAQQAGETLDTVTREVINAGTNVQYGEQAVTSRFKLVGGESSGNHYLTIKAVKQAVRTLKNNKATKIKNDFVSVIHTDVAYDLTEDTNWKAWHQYTDATNMYEGEIGKVEGVRFVETTEAKIFHAANLTAAARDLTVASVSTKTFTVAEAITAGEATALVGRKLIIKGYLYTVASSAAGAAGAATITVSETVSGS